MIADMLKRVSNERIRRDLFYLCDDPLPFRKAGYTRPGRTVSTLDEADAYIASRLEEAGYRVARTEYLVQALRCDETKPIHHWYSGPEPDDPWYTVANIEAVRVGSKYPEEIVQLISHKDSMSWIDSPGAHDNCAGTVTNLELARVLATADIERSIRFLFCNEEHTPWTSRHAADEAARRGDSIIAVFNNDSIASKSDSEHEAGIMKHTVAYSTGEGKALADFVAKQAAVHGIDLEIRSVFKEHVNDDDGMFIKAGFRRTVMNIGSFPNADSQYHLPGDVAARVDIENVARSAALICASVLEISRGGAEIIEE